MRAAAGALFVLVVLAATASAGTAQETSPTPPETVADEFQRAFESMVWTRAARRIHPDALERLHAVVTMLVDTDPRGEVRELLVGGVESADYPALEAAEVFRRVMTALMDETPGLMHALVTRRHEVVGSVPEGRDTVHVVYRVIPRLQGARREVKVMTLARAAGRTGDGGPWRVVRSEELDAVAAALQGIPIGLPAPPPARPDTLEPGSIRGRTSR